MDDRKTAAFIEDIHPICHSKWGMRLRGNEHNAETDYYSNSRNDSISWRRLAWGELIASLAHEIKQPISAAITDAKTCR